MKFLFDIFPVLLFFGVFKWGEGSPETAQSLVEQYLSVFVSGGAASLEIGRASCRERVLSPV